MTLRYLIIIEETRTGFSAYSPDVPGCVAAGNTTSDVEEQMRAAMEFHLEGLREQGDAIPVPHSSSSYVEISA